MSLTLSQKIEDMRTLAIIVRKGWDKMEIFELKDSHDYKCDQPQILKPGWEPIIAWLGDTLPNLCCQPTWSTSTKGVIPSSVYGVLVEIETVLNLCREPIPSGVTGVSILRDGIARIIRDNANCNDAANDIIQLLRDNVVL